MSQTLANDVQRSLLVESRKQSDKAVKYIGALLEEVLGTPQDPEGPFTILKWWYRHASARAPNTSYMGTEKVTGYYSTLYLWVEPTPASSLVPTHITPFKINDDVPTEVDMEVAVRDLHLNKPGGHTHLREEHFKKWLREEYPEEGKSNPPKTGR